MTTMSANAPNAPPSFDASSSLWADVQPIPQDDGEDPLAPILYSAEYAQAMDLLRALLPADELSARALLLTGHLAKLAPSNYTVWYYRARILVHGPDSELGPKKDRLMKELDFLDDLAKENMKNYQVWQHRKLLVEALQDPTRELAFTAAVFEKDPKNYHTWVYRQWVLSRFGGLSSMESTHPNVWDGEMSFVAELLRQDARNNSAWNHRYFCIFASKHVEAQSGNGHRLCTEAWQLGSTYTERLSHEIEYTKEAIKTIPHNASAWNYLRGVSKLAFINDASLASPYACARDLAHTLLPSEAEALASPAIDAPPRSPPLALEWLLDDVDAQVQQLHEGKDAKRGTDELDSLLQSASRLATRLCVADVIRRRFWAYRLTAIRRRASSGASSGHQL